MSQILTTCPVCDAQLTATRLHCRNCDTSIEGHFELGRLGRLDQDQLAFIETFIRCEGKLSRMEKEVGLSYPTLRSRLTEAIQAMGFEVGPEEPNLSDEERHKILDDLANGRLTSEEAMNILEAS
ncbi:MAG: DUF2089 domain-containing protein [Anaerolineales bacterium]